MAEPHVSFTKDSEGFKAKAYPDGSQYSIGYGTATTDPDEIAGIKTISEEEATQRLVDYTSIDREKIVKLGKREGHEWTANELDALTSFSYNLGIDDVSTLISGRDKKTIAEKMKLYNKAEGVEVDGLTARRGRESELFNTPYASERVVPEATAAPSAPSLPQVDKSEDDFVEPMIPTSALREGATPAESEEGPTAKEIWDAATERHWIMKSNDRDMLINSEINDDYLVSQEQVQSFSDAGHSDQEITFLSEASSPENLQHRFDRIKSDKQMKQTIEQGGMKGTGIEMLASIADPALIPSFFLGGTAAAAGKWNSVKAISASMLSGSSQSVAAEYLLKQGDTQRTGDDLLLAGLAGAAFSGVITGGVLGVKSLNQKRIELKQKNEIAAAHNDGVHGAMADKAYHNADEALAAEVPEAVARKRMMTEKEIMQKMSDEIGTPEMIVGKKRVKEAKAKFKAERLEVEGKIAKLKEVPTKKLKARNTQIAAMEKGLADKEAVLMQMIETNNAKLSQKADLDALRQGTIPKKLQARYDEIKAEAGEFKAPTGKIETTRTRAPEVDEEGNLLPDDKSVGAMQTARQFSDIEEGELLTSSEVASVQANLETAADLGESTPRISRLASKGGFFKSLSTVLDGAPDDTFRGMAMQVLKSGARTIKGHQSAEELADTFFFRNVPDYLASESAFNSYAKENGLGILSWGRGALREEFDKQVVLKQVRGELTTNKTLDTDDAITAAAKARARIYERNLKLNKDYEVVGFDNVEHTNSYHSVVYTTDAINGSGADKAEIVDTIANAYMNGKIKLSRENAVRLANTQLERTFSYRSGGNGTFKEAMSDSEFRLLDKELDEAGVDATTRAELKESLFNKEDLKHMSPRAMFSLGPDLTATSGKLRMVDLIDTSMNRVMKYASDAGGNAGLASHGYKSRNQFNAAMEENRSALVSHLHEQQNSTNPKIAKAAKLELEKVVSGEYHNKLDDAVKLMYRESLNSGISDGLEDLTKILRKQTSITRLRATGFMSIPENAIAMARNGAMNTLGEMPKSRYFDLRDSSIENDAFMKEYSEVMSATGHQEYLFGSKFYNNSEFDDATRGRLAGIINNVQGKMMNVTMTVNAFRTFQHGGEEMVARSIMSNLKNMAVEGKITPNVRKSLIDVGGMSEDQINKMIKHFKERPNVDLFESIKQMEPKLHNSLAVASRNTIGSSFMRMGIGESVPYANRELGKIVTNLLNFTLGSWEKMVVRGIKSDGKGLLAAMFAGQSALALLSQYAYVGARATGMEGEERRKYLDKSLSDEGLFWGTFNRVGFLAAPALPLQMLAGANMLPDEITAGPTKGGINSMGLPVLSMGEDVVKAAGAASNIITDKFNDEYMTNKDRERNWKSIKRIMPWVDSPIYNASIGLID